MAWRRVKVKIKGETPIMFHRQSERVQKEISTRVRTQKVASPESQLQEAREALYLDASGRPAIPEYVLCGCLKTAGLFVKNGRANISRRIKVGSQEIIRTTLFGYFRILDEFMPLTNLPPKGDGWVVDYRMARNPNTGNPQPAYRPRFDQWGFECIFEFDDSEVDESTVRSLWAAAGRRAGLCAFRPYCSGKFGTFSVAEWKEVKPKSAAASAN